MYNIKRIIIVYSISIIGIFVLFIFGIIEHYFIKPIQVDIKPLYKKQEEYKRLKALKSLEKENYTN